MSRSCEICGKKTTTGYQIARRGLAKRKGGVGRKITGRTKRKFKANIQVLRANVNGSIKKIKVCTRCMNSGKVTKVV
jgi:large subunit ribosomal protein L28